MRSKERKGLLRECFCRACGMEQSIRDRREDGASFKAGVRLKETCVHCGAKALRLQWPYKMTADEQEKKRQEHLPPEGIKLRQFMVSEGFTFASLQKHLKRHCSLSVHDRTLRAAVYDGRCGYRLGRSLGKMMQIRGYSPAELWPGCNHQRGGFRTCYRTDYWAWYDNRVLTGLMEENPKWPVPRKVQNRMEKYGRPRID